jgi:branched-chain amino acid transport system ATP-binding protein
MDRTAALSVMMPEPVGRPRAAGAPLIAVEGLVLRFGGVTALDGISFTADERSITSIIGPNGAGKTSLFNCLSRLYIPSEGRVLFDGRPLEKESRHAITAIGIARTFQNLALFNSMTVYDNILVGCHSTMHTGFLAAALRLPSVSRDEERAHERADEMCRLLKLDAVAHLPVSELDLGARKRVELARALASRPRLLLLDEPAAGLNHTEVGELGRLISSIRDQLDITVLLVEHHMNLVMSISDKIVVLNFGRKLAEGDAKTIRSHPEVIRAYLGGSA